MSTKVYKAFNHLTVPIVVDGKIDRYINFGEEGNTFRTNKTDIQNALESLPIFKKLFKLHQEIKDPEVKSETPPVESVDEKTIGAVGNTGEDGMDGGSGLEDEGTGADEDSKSYPEVTNWQEAKEILRKEYGVAHQSIGTPEKIAAKAEELGVRFENLK